MISLMFNQIFLILYVSSLISIIFFCKNIPIYPSKSKFRITVLDLNSIAFIFITIAFFILIYNHIENNFGILNVVHSSNSNLPVFFRFSGVWGSHSGSMILWCWILSFYSLLYNVMFSIEDKLTHYYTIVINSIVGTFFGLYTILTSNPFLNMVDICYEGKELNPVLQDVILAIHPPLIYMGYLGSMIPFSVCFSLLIKHFKTNFELKVENGQILQLKNIVKFFARISWILLSVGILLGSWWAYYELGWGGFWFWDPVENASLLPWIALTILLHDSKSGYLSWILCSFLSFYSSILGTFLVRSGLVESVHSFASDNQRGFWVMFFLIVIMLVFILPFIRLVIMTQDLNVKKIATQMSTWSQMILCWIYIIVLIGTFYPSIHMLVFKEGISIGPSFYNQMIIPFLLPAVILMTLTNYINSLQNIQVLTLCRLIAFPLGISIGVISTSIMLFNEYYEVLKFADSLYISSLFMVVCSFTLIVSLIINLYKLGRRNIYYNTIRDYNVLLGHFGVGIGILGLSSWNMFSREKHLIMYPGDAEHFMGKTWLFREVNFLKGPNYDSFYGNFALLDRNSICGVIFPEKRHYFTGDTYASKVDIQSNIFSDYHIIIGDGNIFTGWSTHIYYYPFISFLWMSGIFFLCGILYSLYINSNLAKATNKK